MKRVKKKTAQRVSVARRMKVVRAHGLLAVFAHPDDETFTAGGTLALHAMSGCRVTLICATHGEKGSAGREGFGEAAYKQLRVAELHEAAEALGIAEVILWDWGDGQVAERDEESSVREILAVMQRTRPAVVMTFGPDGISGHPDHIALSQLATAAFERYRQEMRSGALQPRLLYIVPSTAIPSCCWQREGTPTPLPATTTFDIRAVRPRKLAAMRAYRSQSHLVKALRQDHAAWHAQEECFHQAFPALFDQEQASIEAVMCA
jgi:LmbE family N-acetylglucosaminyl deacetylase